MRGVKERAIVARRRGAGAAGAGDPKGGAALQGSHRNGKKREVRCFWMPLVCTGRSMRAYARPYVRELSLCWRRVARCNTCTAIGSSFLDPTSLSLLHRLLPPAPVQHASPPPRWREEEGAWCAAMDSRAMPGGT